MDVQLKNIITDIFIKYLSVQIKYLQYGESELNDTEKRLIKILHYFNNIDIINDNLKTEKYDSIEVLPLNTSNFPYIVNILGKINWNYHNNIPFTEEELTVIHNFHIIIELIEKIVNDSSVVINIKKSNIEQKQEDTKIIEHNKVYNYEDFKTSSELDKYNELYNKYINDIYNISNGNNISYNIEYIDSNITAKII